MTQDDGDIGPPYRMDSPPGAEAVINGRPVDYFAGTGYLGLAGHPDVIEAGCAALRACGVHSATVRSGFGTTGPVLDVERRVADWLGVDDAAYLASGYLSPSALVAAIGGRFDAAYIDEHAHDSIRAALAVAGAPIYPFAHRDADALLRMLRETKPTGTRPLVFTDGVFAVTGAIAPVLEYADALTGVDGALLAIDDAHGLGVLGDGGRGTFEHAGLNAPAINRTAVEHDAEGGPALLHCATLSKAVGGHGGIVAGSAAFIECLRGDGRSYAAASAPTAAAAGSTAKALELLTGDPTLRERLRANVARLKAGLPTLGLEGIDDTPVPIVGLAIGDGANMDRVQRELMRRSIAVAYIPRYAGVGAAGMVRISVCAAHTEAQIDRLIAELGAAL